MPTAMASVAARLGHALEQSMARRRRAAPAQCPMASKMALVRAGQV